MHRDLKLAAAQSEKEYKGAGTKVGIECWRIEKMKIKKQDPKTLGTFFSGDAYIVLNTYKIADSDKLNYNVHFWLGAECTQDEWTVAAYKTVELDDLLSDVPVQYREVQGFESPCFIKLFPEITILAGGIESGFNFVKPESYEARLLHVKGDRKNGGARVKEVKCEAASLNDGDTFVLDNGLMLWQWNGTSANHTEKQTANETIRALKDARNGKPKSNVLDGLEEDGDFWKLLGGKPAKIGAAIPDVKNVEFTKKVYRISDSTGTLQITPCATNSKSDLQSDDVFIVDCGQIVYVWIGSGASKQERKQCMHYASLYLEQEKRPPHTPVSRILEGAESMSFKQAF